MDVKREIPIVKCSGGNLLSQRVQFVRSTFDWAVCSEPLARLRRTRAYGYSMVSWRSVLGGKFELGPKSGIVKLSDFDYFSAKSATISGTSGLTASHMSQTRPPVFP